MGGIQLSSTGQVYVTAAPAVTDTYDNGFRVSALGQLVITPGGAVASFQEGIPRDSNSAVVTLANATPVPIPGAVMGPELVSNGDFSNGTTGWTSSVAVLSVIGGQLEVSSLGDGASANQIIPIVSGRSYRLSVLATAPSTNVAVRAARIASSNPSMLAFVTAEDVQQTLAYNFIAVENAVTVRPQVASDAVWGAVGDKAYFDAISLREVDTNAYNMLGGLSIANTGLYTTDAVPSILELA